MLWQKVTHVLLHVQCGCNRVCDELMVICEMGDSRRWNPLSDTTKDRHFAGLHLSCTLRVVDDPHERHGATSRQDTL